jgi:hypothetical protein
MIVVTFEDYVPPPRYDGIKWTQARIQEAPASTGAWTQLEVKTIPDYPDPTTPPTLNFTTELATLEEGWYRIVFVDATSDTAQPTNPVHNADDTTDVAFAPTVDQLGSLMRTRTKDSHGNERGTFTAETRPTRAAVEHIIQGVADDVISKHDQIDPACQESARESIKLKAAMEIELSYFPEQVATGRSPFEQYKELYDDAILSLASCVSFHVAEGASSPLGVAYHFPEKPPIIGLETKM